MGAKRLQKREEDAQAQASRPGGNLITGAHGGPAGAGLD